jgi:DNA-binding winged helix-turn-helix (wHTH) protein/tetratricopeptide (TPR) repeat protein
MPDRSQVLRFGAFEAHPHAGELRRNGRRLKLQEQPFQVLLALIEQPGEVVSRDDLRQRLWPADTFVDFDNGLNIAVRKLRQALDDDPEKPRYIETLPRRGYRFIAPVEQAPESLTKVGPVAGERDDEIPPRARVVSIGGAAQPAADPQSLPPAGPVAVPASDPRQDWFRRTRTRLHAGYAIALGVLSLAAAFLIRQQWQRRDPRNMSTLREAESPHALALRPSVATLRFKNLKGDADADWLSTALPEMISTELAAGGQLRTVSGESVARARIDLSLPDSDSYVPATLLRIQKNLAADYVVAGSYLVTQDNPAARLRLDLRLQNTSSGVTMASLSEDGAEGDLSDLVSRAGTALRARLGVGAVTTEQSQRVRAALPSNAEVAELYGKGLAKLRAYDVQGARDLLERAVATDPRYALAHSALAEAWSRLGYGELAKGEAKKALDLSGGLSREDRLSIEARYRETASEWDKAVEKYRTLAAFYPDNVDYGLRLAAADVKAGKGQDALAAIAALRKLGPPVADDPALDFMSALAKEQLGDLRGAQAAAALAADRAQALSEGTLAAAALARECRELPLLGRFNEARDSCPKARELYARAGDQYGAAEATGYLAAVLANQGQRDAAKQMYEEALAVDEQIGNQAGELWELNGLANASWAQGDFSGARARYSKALVISRQIGSRSDEADALNNIGLTRLLEGDLAQAHRMFDDALAAYRCVSDRRGVASALDNLGTTLYFQGDLAEAARALNQALGIDREIGSRPESADVLAWSGRVRMAQGKLDDARQSYRQAVEVWNEIGNRTYTAKYGLRLAELSIETGGPSAAEEPIRQDLEVFKEEKRADDELECHILLAEVLLGNQKPREAQHEIDEGVALVARTQNRASRLEFSIVAARVRAAAGSEADLRAARKLLDQAQAAAVRDGFLGYDLEARLALGEIALQAGQASAGARLEAVERDATAKGFGLIARKAAELGSRT